MNEAGVQLRVALAMCLLAAIACFSSCAPTPPSLVAEGLLLGEPCGPPCWQGLVPGVSTGDELNEFFRAGTTYQYVDFHTVERSRHGESLTVRWQPRGETRSQNLFEVQDGILEVMRMCVDSDVTLGQLVDRYGPPDKFQAGLSVHPEPVCVVVELFYREDGMITELRVPTDDPELIPDTPVAKVEYFEPAALEDVLVTLAWKRGRPLGDDELQLLERWLVGWHEWQGYGTVELTY